jgi:hypothetical protein
MAAMFLLGISGFKSQGGMKSKGKIVPVCSMKHYGSNRCKASFILNFSTRCEWSASLHSCFTPRVKKPHYIEWKAVWARSWFGYSGEETNPSSLPGIKPQFCGHDIM